MIKVKADQEKVILYVESLGQDIPIAMLNREQTKSLIEDLEYALINSLINPSKLSPNIVHTRLKSYNSTRTVNNPNVITNDITLTVITED